MEYSNIIKRLNAASNFFAGTVGVEYLDGFSAAEVRAMDSEMRTSVRLFPELKKMGY
jgi:hypothetical protein